MSCCARPCFAMLCCAMLGHAMLCHAVPSFATLCCAMLGHAILCHAVPSFAALCQALPRCAVPDDVGSQRLFLMCKKAAQGPRVGGYLSGALQSKQWQACWPSCSGAPPAEHARADTSFCPRAPSAPHLHCPTAHEQPACRHADECLVVAHYSLTPCNITREHCNLLFGHCSQRLYALSEVLHALFEVPWGQTLCRLGCDWSCLQVVVGQGT